MESFCSVVCVIGVIIIVCLIIAAINDSAKKSQQEKVAAENARQNRISSYKSNIESYKRGFYNGIISFFLERSSADRSIRTYESVYSSLLQYIENIRNENRKLSNESASMEESLVNHLISRADQFREFGAMVQSTNFKTMVIPDEYGKINKEYWNEIRKMNSSEVDTIVNSYNSWLKSGKTEKFKSIRPVSIPAYAWFYATEKPYAASKFKTARDVFFNIFKGRFADLEVAEFYAIKQMGGDDVLRERIRELLKADAYNSDELTMIASGLMWMNAYQEENMVLQHMLSTGKHMTLKTQERLHSLSIGGDKAPSGFDATSSATKMCFDVSSLAWKDEEYTGFFENLSFQDKTLSYSLAVRDEDKDLFITQGIEVPNMDSMLRKINEVFYEEYGNIVSATIRQCVALSGSGEEIMKGILAESQECNQMGLLVHIARIGKKLNIKFYTLFMPGETNLMSQKQQALSLYKKLSPSVTIWESSMKETILMAIQQLLNTEPQGNPSITDESDINNGLAF